MSWRQFFPESGPLDRMFYGYKSLLHTLSRDEALALCRRYLKGYKQEEAEEDLAEDDLPFFLAIQFRKQRVGLLRSRFAGALYLHAGARKHLFGIIGADSESDMFRTAREVVDSPNRVALFKFEDHAMRGAPLA